MLLFAAPYFPPVYYGGVVQVYLGLLQRLPGYRIVVVADRHGLRDEDATGWDEIAQRDFGFEVRRIDAFEFHLRHAPPRQVSTPDSRHPGCPCSSLDRPPGSGCAKRLRPGKRWRRDNVSPANR